MSNLALSNPSALLRTSLHSPVSDMKHVVLFIIHIYQKYISPAFPPSCRFTPSCSHYGYEAIEKYGLLKGGWLAIKRIGRCHPFNPGGYDPVP